MTGMTDFAFSTKMRDTIIKIAEEAIQRSRPVDRYGVVSSIDLVNKKCGVTLNGETAPVLVNLGALYPSAVGQTVRVSGTAGDKYVADVFGAVAFDQATGRYSSTTELDLTSTGHGLQIGASSGANLAADTNEIQARNNGAAAQLVLNPHSGGVHVGGVITDILSVGDSAGNNLAINGNQIVGRSGTTASGHLYLNHGSTTTTPRVYIGKGGNLSVGSSGSDLGGGVTGSDQVNTAAGYLRLNWETANPVAIGPSAGANTLIRPGLDVTGTITATSSIVADVAIFSPQFRAGDQAAANVVINGNHVYARTGATNNGTLNLNNSITAPVVIGTNGHATTVNTNALTYPNFPTAGTANASLTAGGVFQRISSSRRYKDNITDLEIDVEAALKLRPRQFIRNDRTDAVKFTDEDGTEYHELAWFPPNEFSPLETGFVAEEAEELGLNKWVEYNESGEVEGFFYMNWIAAQQAMIRHQHEKILDLEGKLAAFESRLATLEAA